ncbi:hypothetical protein A7N06_20455 [Acinetobacter baumannii]|nr:hypothetical protein A7N06_20455 [Acinetobacter baumannii]
MSPKPKPVPKPIVMISVRTFWANMLTMMQLAAKMEPAMVTARQPYRFTNDELIGPDEKVTPTIMEAIQAV